jgi:hypothetical protein
MRTVNELNQDELNELRENYYYSHIDDGSLFEVFEKEIESPNEIPVDIVKVYYEGTYFVDEDFFCNL